MVNEPMNAEFYRPASLAHLFDWVAPIHRNTKWLFVRLDSNLNLADMEIILSPQLKLAGVEFAWRPEGLWIPGTELTKSFIPDNVAVPFSACYIFDEQTTGCAKPRFNITTDAELPFTGLEAESVVEEILNLRALGYAADGCGLQWVSAAEELSHSIREGFRSWQANVIGNQ
jgi:hypothetical protein